MTEEQRLPIEYPEQPNPPKRPKISDEKVRMEAARRYQSRIKEEWADYEENVDGEEEEIESIADCLDRCYMFDGYEIARKMENYGGWGPDAHLVEIMDRGYLHDVLREQVISWVTVNGIRPKFATGQEVITRKGVGTIQQVYLDRAEYAVKIPHDPPGAYIFAFEDCTEYAVCDGDVTAEIDT
jgi:hypothetical protein